jgi:signal transduction histidine kinase
MKARIAGFCAILLVACSAPAAAVDRHSPDEAKAVTLRAAAVLSKHGIDEARRMFHADGLFKYDEIYVNVIDFNGTWLIYPPNPRNEGKSVLNVKDADGKLLVQDIIRVAQNDGEGWVEYRWLNPATNKIEMKQTFVKRVENPRVITYVGVYR